ncbi:hypothetical protein IWQ60_012164 [Tieghemiomyces parasiticus]|uniref:Zinc transporter n=1 Tax=Tieghemiomyces parasiticus TaxID=78921 RepID=A0A9W8DL01_9FUNG|nr:hypothetical protein IWQ60_012164 [Tieghemiomyces parasiticus]
MPQSGLHYFRRDWRPWLAVLAFACAATFALGHGHHGHTRGGKSQEVDLTDTPPACPHRENCPVLGKIIRGHHGEVILNAANSPDAAEAAADPTPPDHADPQACPYYGKKPVWSKKGASGQLLPPGHPAVAVGAADTDCPYTKVKRLIGLASSDTDHGAATRPPLWTYLFSDDPKISAFLATTYISVFPNLVLLFVPPNIAPRSLNILVSFAVGGLLGDVLLHLLPHSFTEIVHSPASDHPQQVTVVGLSIFLGLMVFFAIDKLMRISGGGHSHSHGHGHAPEGAVADEVVIASATKTITTNSAAEKPLTGPASNLRRRRSKSNPSSTDEAETERTVTRTTTVVTKIDEPVVEPSSVKFSAYLNIIADATHNFTDGLAMAASFYSSPAIGVSTTVAVFFHEIPHEIGDYAILVQSGLSRRQALMAQCVTALGAFAGTLAGVLIQELGGASGGELDQDNGVWYLAGLAWGDLVIPFTAGGFIYIATVGVLPELLESTSTATGATETADGITQAKTRTRNPIRQAGYEFATMLLGVLLMALVNA